MRLPSYHWLLRASLELNYVAGSDLLRAQHNILMIHILGDLNLGDASIVIDNAKYCKVYGKSWDANYRVSHGHMRSLAHPLLPPQLFER